MNIIARIYYIHNIIKERKKSSFLSIFEDENFTFISFKAIIFYEFSRIWLKLTYGIQVNPFAKKSLK